MNLTIYHNPRCRKSREALQHLESAGYNIEVRNYLTDILSRKEIEILLKQLDFQPQELIRTNELIWKEKFKGKQLDNKKLIEALHSYPKLVERPIISNGSKAVIARPIEKLITFLK